VSALTPSKTATHFKTLQQTATHCNILTRCDETQERLCGDDCNALQHTATHCNTLQHTATQCTIQSVLASCHTATHWFRMLNTILISESIEFRNAFRMYGTDENEFIHEYCHMGTAAWEACHVHRWVLNHPEETRHTVVLYTDAWVGSKVRQINLDMGNIYLSHRLCEVENHTIWDIGMLVPYLGYMSDFISHSSIYVKYQRVCCSVFPVCCSVFPVCCSVFPVCCSVFPLCVAVCSHFTRRHGRGLTSYMDASAIKRDIPQYTDYEEMEHTLYSTSKWNMRNIAKRYSEWMDW